MRLLAGTFYDPAIAVSKSTASAIAMTALDTTNLRLTFNAPQNGIVRINLAGVLHGATTMPQILLGVMAGAIVRGRQAPNIGASNIAATSLVQVNADFLVTGLVAGAQITWDAAYGVETAVASTGLKYGGPDNATANNAFGGFTFMIWDVLGLYP